MSHLFTRKKGGEKWRLSESREELCGDGKAAVGTAALTYRHFNRELPLEKEGYK